MVAKYVRVLENKEVYDKTGSTWTIYDVPKTWRSKVEAQILADGYFVEDDGTVSKIVETE